jgi:hypothetical protein
MIDFTLSNKLSSDLIISNDLLCVLQQIDLLFSTNINDVLGDTTFGSNYDKYLYTLGMSNTALESKIKSDINKLDLLGFDVDVKVSIVEGTVRDIAFIEITIYSDYEEYNKTYLIK